MNSISTRPSTYYHFYSNILELFDLLLSKPFFFETFEVLLVKLAKWQIDIFVEIWQSAIEKIESRNLSILEKDMIVNSTDPPDDILPILA